MDKKEMASIDENPFEAIKVLNISHENTARANKDMKKDLHHKNIWSHVITAALGLMITLITIAGLIISLFLKKHRETLRSLKGKHGEIKLVSNSSVFDDW